MFRTERVDGWVMVLVLFLGWGSECLGEPRYFQDRNLHSSTVRSTIVISWFLFDVQQPSGMLSSPKGIIEIVIGPARIKSVIGPPYLKLVLFEARRLFEACLTETGAKSRFSAFKEASLKLL